MKQPRDKIKQSLSKASDVILDAIASPEGDQVIINVCKQKGLTPPQTAEVSSEVVQVMLGLTKPEDFVASIVARTGVKEDVAVEIAKEINEKIFRPIRDELKKVHGIPTVETLRTTNAIPNEKLITSNLETNNTGQKPVTNDLLSTAPKLETGNFVPKPNPLPPTNIPRPDSAVPQPPTVPTPPKTPEVLPITYIHKEDSLGQNLDSHLRGNDKGGEIRPVPKPPIVPFGAPKTEGLPNLMKKPASIVIPTKPVARENLEVKPMTDWQKAQPPEPPNPYRTMREDATKAFMGASHPAPFIKNVDDPSMTRESLINSMENPEHSEVKNYVPQAVPKNPANSDDISVLRSKLSGITNVAKTEVKFVPISTQDSSSSDPYREALG